MPLYVVHPSYLFTIDKRYCFGVDDLWPESERKANPEEPSWVQSEKDQFREYRDKNKDGKLNKVRIRDLLVNLLVTVTTTE